MSTFNRELRRHRRYTVGSGGTMEVSWINMRGQMRTSRARVVNVSETGLAIQLPEEAMPLRVRFQSEQGGVDGVGSVRHCSRSGSKYVVGLEFALELGWHPPQGDVTEPIPLFDPLGV